MKRIIIVCTAILVAVILAATITIVIVVRNAQIDAKKAACDLEQGFQERYLCLRDAER